MKREREGKEERRKGSVREKEGVRKREKNKGMRMHFSLLDEKPR
jgi:hypothetical protein